MYHVEASLSAFLPGAGTASASLHSHLLLWLVVLWQRCNPLLSTKMKVLLLIVLRESPIPIVSANQVPAGKPSGQARL